MIRFRQKTASFLYTSANLNDISRLQGLYYELETIDLKKDARHKKCNDWVDFDMGDDYDEDV